MLFVVMYNMPTLNKIYLLYLLTCETRKNVRKTQICRVFLPILLRKTRKRRSFTCAIIDKLRRLSL